MTHHITAKEPVFANPFDSAAKGLHLKPVRRLFKRVGPGGGEPGITPARLVASRPAGAGGARRRTDIAAGTKRMQKARLPAIPRDAGICWRSGGCHTGSSACLVGDPVYAAAYNRKYPILCRMSR